MKRNGKIPVGWLPYSPIGQQVQGTRFIAFKVPLKESFVEKLKPEDRFTVPILLDRIPELGLIIDLTQTDKYYNKNEVLDRGVDYIKIRTPGQQVPSQEYVDRFFEAVDYFLESRKDDDSLIGVHCTHGVNRTGYMICRYLIQRLGHTYEEAIQAVGSARGHMIERSPYLASLRSHTDSVQKKSARAAIEEGKPTMPKKSLKSPKKAEVPRPTGTGKEKFGRRDPYSGGEGDRSRSPQRARPRPSPIVFDDRTATLERERMPPAKNVRDRLDPPLPRARTPPHMRGRTSPLRSRGNSPPPRGRSPPPIVRGRSPPPIVRGRSPPPIVRGRTPPPHIRGRTPSPPGHLRGRTPPQHLRGRSPPPQLRGRTPPPHMRGRTPPPQMRGRTPPSQMRGRTPPHMIGRAPPGHMRGRTPPSHMRGHSPPPSHLRGRTPPPMRRPSPSRVRGRSAEMMGPPHHIRGRSPPMRGRSPQQMAVRGRSPIPSGPMHDRSSQYHDSGRGPPDLRHPRGRSPPPIPRGRSFERSAGHGRTPPHMDRGRSPNHRGIEPPLRDYHAGRREPFPPGRKTPPASKRPPTHVRGRTPPPSSSSRRSPVPAPRRDMSQPDPYFGYRGGYDGKKPNHEESRDYRDRYQGSSSYPSEPGSSSHYYSDPYAPSRKERSRSPQRRGGAYYPESRDSRREPSPRESRKRKKSPIEPREKSRRSPPNYFNGRSADNPSDSRGYDWNLDPDCREILNERRSVRDPYGSPPREYDDRKRSLLERLPPKNVDLRNSLEEEKRRKHVDYPEPGYPVDEYGGGDRKKPRRDYPEPSYGYPHEAPPQPPPPENPPPYDYHYQSYQGHGEGLPPPPDVHHYPEPYYPEPREKLDYPVEEFRRPRGRGGKRGFDHRGGRGGRGRGGRF